MGFVEAIKTCLSKFATFSGRASRAEYWWFYLFVALVSIATEVLDRVLFGQPDAPEAATAEAVETAMASNVQSEPLTLIWGLLMVLPVLAAGWRRAQDSGKPGWYILLPGIAALIGIFGLLLGVAGFGLLDSLGADPERLRGAAAILGVTGLLALAAVVIALSIYKIVLLVQPSDPETNAYGPPPTA